MYYTGYYNPHEKTGSGMIYTQHRKGRRVGLQVPRDRLAALGLLESFSPRARANQDPLIWVSGRDLAAFLIAAERAGEKVGMMTRILDPSFPEKPIAILGNPTVSDDKGQTPCC